MKLSGIIFLRTLDTGSDTHVGISTALGNMDFASTFAHLYNSGAHAIAHHATAHVITHEGVILAFAPISYFAPASPHSIAISAIFAPIASFLPAHSNSDHFLRTPILFGHIRDAQISATVSPTLADVVVGSNCPYCCMSSFPCFHRSAYC